MQQIDRDGQFSYSHEVEVAVGEAAKGFSLEQNYPNPFNPTTTIGFTLQETGFTTIKIYDANGREVAVLANEVLGAGVQHQIQFDASKTASSYYVVVLKSGTSIQWRKMMLLK